MHTAIKELEDEASNADSILLRSHEKKQKDVLDLLANCRTVLTQLDGLITKYKSLGTRNKKKWDAIRFSSEGLSELRSKIAFHTSAINLFFTTVGTGSLGRIEKRLDEMASEIQAGIRDADSVAHLDEHELNASQAELELNALKDELVQEGFARQDLEAHKTEVKKRLRGLVSATVHESTEAIDETAVTYQGRHSTYQDHPMGSALRPLQNSPQFGFGNINESAADWSGLDLSYLPPLDRPWSPMASPHYFHGNALPTLKRRASSPIYHPGYSRHNASPSPEFHRSGSNVSLAGSVHSDITTYDGQGRVMKRTITTEWPSPEPDNQQVLIRNQSNGFQCTHLGCTAARFQTQDQLDDHAKTHVSSGPHFCAFVSCPRGPGGQGFDRKNEQIRHEIGHKHPRYLW